MDPRLIEYFNSELAYMRELGQEFAEQHPKIASRLGMNGVEVADPFVERLLEGFSFLSARIQLKMDAQFPHFSQRLLEKLYPNYLAPTPSMAIVELRPDMKQGTLASGFLVPKDSSLFANIAKGEKTACQFRTGHDVTLWPLEILDVSCTGAPPDLPLAGLGLERPVKGAIRIRLRVTKGLLVQLSVDNLTFYLSGGDDVASHLYEYLFAHALGIVGCEPQRPAKWMKFLPPQTITAEGFGNDQSMLPFDKRAFQGYRLLHEYFAFPHRYQFFTLTGLQKFFSSAEGDTLDLTILLDCPVGKLETQVDKQQLTLFCTPVINLFPRRGDNLKIDPQRPENHLPADKNLPLDFEIYSVNVATGHEEQAGKHREFHAFNAALESNDGPDVGYYSVRRELSMTPEASRGVRSSYISSEIYLSLVDRDHAPLNHTLQALSIDALCTNRDLARSVPRGGTTDLVIEDSAPVVSVNMRRGPTEPRMALAEGARTWRLISHLDPNFMELIDLNPDEGAKALREMLSLYSPLGDRGVRNQIEALRHVKVTAITKRLPATGGIAMGRGLGIELTVDETMFDGTSPYLFGSVLEQFFPRYVSQNSFTEMVLKSPQRGEIARWKLRMGKRPVA